MPQKPITNCTGYESVSSAGGISCGRWEEGWAWRRLAQLLQADELQIRQRVTNPACTMRPRRNGCCSCSCRPGVSHIDTFDHKPGLRGNITAGRADGQRKYHRCIFPSAGQDHAEPVPNFSQYGQTGKVGL